MEIEATTLQEEEEVPDNKRARQVSAYEVKLRFMKEVTDNYYTVFGGAVRDYIAGVECNDIDIYIECRKPRHAESFVQAFIKTMGKYSFIKISKHDPDHDSDHPNNPNHPNANRWTSYKNFENKEFPATLMRYLVTERSEGSEGLPFNVDIVLSRFSPCFGNLDCVVNGLCMKKNQITFVTNFKHPTLQKMKNNELVNFAKKLIGERRAGLLPNCDQYRTNKMIAKGYSPAYIIETHRMT